MQEDYKRFVRVVDQCATYDVPTKEEYKDFRENVGYYLERLGSRIAVLEKARPEGEESDVYTKEWFVPPYGKIEVTGTAKQFAAFMERYNEHRKLLSEYLNGNDVVLLALNCGLSVKKTEVEINV